MSFIIENAGSIITALVLVAVLALAITVICKRRKSGKSSCCGGCDFCGMDCKQKSMNQNHR